MHSFIIVWYVSLVRLGISVTFMWNMKHVYIVINEQEHNKYRLSINDF